MLSGAPSLCWVFGYLERWVLYDKSIVFVAGFPVLVDSLKRKSGLVLPPTSVTCDKNYKKPLFSMAETT